MNAPSFRSADTARPGSDEQDAPASPAPPQGERHTRTLMELLACCEAWEPDVRILGNVSAEDAADAIRASLRAAPAVPVAQDEREAPSVDAAYYMGAKGGQANEAERLAFEAWMRGHCWALCAEWTGTQYLGSSEQGGDVDPRAMMTRRLWAAWRDRAALSAATPPAAVPADVLAALDRMCTPLDESWLKGATAEADAHCMKLIRDYVLGHPAAVPMSQKTQDGHSTSRPGDPSTAPAWVLVPALSTAAMNDAGVSALHERGHKRVIWSDAEACHAAMLAAAPTRRSAAEAQKPNEHGPESAALQPAGTQQRCPSCNGNDMDAPCAYPSEGMPGCLRNQRIAASLGMTIIERTGTQQSDTERDAARKPACQMLMGRCPWSETCNPRGTCAATIPSQDPLHHPEDQ